MITSVSLPVGMTSIANYAFYGCSSLGSIDIPASVANIGNSAFNGCSSQQSIVIPDGVTSINTNTFSGCTSLSSVTIPISVSSVDWSAFGSCQSLADVYYGSTQHQWEVLTESIRGSNDYLLNANIHCTDILQVINSGTCGNDITWTLYNDGELVIEGSGEMTQIYTSDQSPWYSYRSMITSVSIEGDVTSISNFAFYGCSALVTATIPSTVLSVGSSAFRGCDSLQDVYYGGTQSEWEILEKSVNSTGNSYLLEANIHYAVQNDEAANDGEDSHAENDANDTADADNVGNADDGDPEIPDASGNAQNVFTDVPDDAWYHDVVYSADANGYMNGYSGTSNFGPEDNLTRGQSAIIAYKMSGGTYYADNPNGQSGLSTQFSDCPEGAYYNYAINWAAGLGIVTGYENNGSLIYDPDGNVSREQFAAILARYAQVYGNYSAPSSTEISTLLASYDDGDAVSDWSKEYVAWAVKEEIMGQNTPSLNPLGDITRAEAAAMIVRLQPNPI